jgi:hypothetical protein
MASEICRSISCGYLFIQLKQFGMKFSTLKSKFMAFKGWVPVRSKIVVDNTVLAQVNTLHISDIEFLIKRTQLKKIGIFLQILGILNSGLKPYLVQIQSW